MSDFLAGFCLGLWTMGLISATAWWISRSLRFEEPKPWE